MAASVWRISCIVLTGAMAFGLARADDDNGPANRARSHVKTQKPALAASDDDQFDAGDATTDDDGTEHVRFSRKYKGLRVIGGDVVVHGDSGGKFLGASLSQSSALNINTSPSVSAGAAKAYGESLFGGQIGKPTQAELVIYARQSPAVLAWDVSVSGVIRGLASAPHFIVDAGSMQLLDRWNDIQHASASGLGHSLYAGDVPLTTDRQSGSYLLRDPTRGSGYVTDMASASTGNGSIFSDADNVWGNNSMSDPASAAVDAAYGQRLTWDYYKSVLGRSGLDNRGLGAMLRVHYGTAYAGAFFDTGCVCMSFGDGDGLTTRAFVGIDVIGHEITHGVTFKTSNLIYSGESGGLNEGSSDIMGTMVEFYAANSISPPNYLIAERAYLVNSGVLQPSFGRRYMFKPSLDGLSPDCYSSAVAAMDPHQASAIANHFFYLLAEGAAVPAGFPQLTPAALVCNGNVSLTALGRTVAAKIWYRALTVYMTTSTDYQGARTATLKAAADLYGSGSATQLSVHTAWAAVAVNGTAPVAASPTRSGTSTSSNSNSSSQH